MPEERTVVVSRREPVTTVVEMGDEKLKFDAYEIPRWRGRNDLANELVKQYAKAMNEWLHTTEIDGEVLLEGNAFEEIIDYDQLFILCYGSYNNYTKDSREVLPPDPALIEQFERLNQPAMVAVLSGALEVNGLERMAYMLDRSKKDLKTPAISESPSESDGPRMESLPASG